MFHFAPEPWIAETLHGLVNAALAILGMAGAVIIAERIKDDDDNDDGSV